MASKRALLAVELLESRRVLDAGFAGMATELDKIFGMSEAQLVGAMRTAAKLPIVDTEIQSFSDDASQALKDVRVGMKNALTNTALDSSAPESTIYSALYPLVRPYLRDNNGNGTSDDLSVTRKRIRAN